jgi:drug/metabolite transporter (DMT)-like permease
MQDAPSSSRGLWLGLLGVTLFAATLPMARIATGTVQAPLMSALFIATGRAMVAGMLSLCLLAWMRAKPPVREDWPALAMTAGGVVFGFPFFTSLAMRHVPAVHASVILGVLPLATAIVGAWLQRQRPSPMFWLCGILGCAWVVGYALLRAGSTFATLHFQAADFMLFVAMACAAVGYGFGGRLSKHMRAEHVICWALVISMPITTPLAIWSWPDIEIPLISWGAFTYMSVFSMWLGFFAWYRGLALGGTVRVSQVQLVQPFLGMLFSVPLLGETLDTQSLVFGLGVIVIVFFSKKAPVHPR